MAKLTRKQKQQKKAAKAIAIDHSDLTDSINDNKLLPDILQSFRNQAIFIALLSFIFYINTVKNEYALDDGIVIQNNDYVQQGVGGIGKILSRDAYDSFYRQLQAQDQLSGGRYRPLSIVTFAIEQAFFGDAPHLRHFINVIFFMISVIALLYLLRYYLLKSMPAIAFLSVVLFAIHPIHTEVVANIKSRDELFSLLFITLTLIQAFKWQEHKKNTSLILALVYFFLALLSKEWGITLIALIPIAFYIFLKYDLKKCLVHTLPFLAVGILFLMIRFKIVNGFGKADELEILNNPYALATKLQTIATKLYVLLKYLLLLLFPYPLSADYSYKSIPYLNFGSINVWASIFIHLGLCITAVVLFFKRHPLGFALLFYLAHLAIISNFAFNIGATMGERLIYHSSVGFCIALAWLFYFALQKIKSDKTRIGVFSALMTTLILLSGFKTIQRNSEWKNDKTLFIRDAKYSPNSIMINGNAGKSFIELFEDSKLDSVERYHLLDSATFYLLRSIKNHGGYYIGYLNLGTVEFHKKNYDKTEFYWNKADSIFPRKRHPGFWQKYDASLASAFHTKGIYYGMRKDFNTAARYFERALKYDPKNAELWYDMGGVNYELKNYTKAKACWEQTLKLDPKHANAKIGYDAVTGYLNQQKAN